MISTILNALLPIIFVTLLGWLARRMRLLGPDAITALSTFVVSFALPLSLFLAAAHTKPAQLTNAAYAASLAAGLLGTYALGIIVSRLMFRHDMQTSALEGLSCGFPNMAYCGPPVLMAAVGVQGLLAVIVGNLIVTLIMVPLTIVLVHVAPASNAGKKESEALIIERSLIGALKQPLVWLPVLGAVLAIAGAGLPDLIDNAVDEIGKAAGGVALFTLGLMLPQKFVRLGRDVLANIVLKNFVQAAIMLGAAFALRLDSALTKEVFLIGVLPTTTATSVLAQRYETYAPEAAATCAGSMLFSIATIAGGLAIAASL